MLRNEVWQCSGGVAPRPEHEYYYTGRRCHWRLVKLNAGRWKNGKKGKILAIAGLGIRLAGCWKPWGLFCAAAPFFAPFSNSNWRGPACARAAQGQNMGKRSENHPICVKRAENHPICVQWKTVGQVMFWRFGFNLRKNWFWANWQQYQPWL